MFSLTTQFLLSSLLVHQMSCFALVERLLESAIQSAQCEARCQGLASQEDLQECLDVCGIVIKNPDSSLCMFPRLCTGGCKVACQDQDVGVRDHSLETQISSLSQDHCQLSWEIDNVDNEKVVFIIAGLDHTGMISIVSRSVLDTKMEMTPAMMSKYVKMIVLAVESDGLTDRAIVHVETTKKCQDSDEDINEVQETTTDSLFQAPTYNLSSQSSEEVVVKQLLENYSLTALSLILMTFLIISLALLIYICSIRRSRKPNYTKFSQSMEV